MACCTKCGAEISERTRFCTKCGAPHAAATSVAAANTPDVADVPNGLSSDAVAEEAPAQQGTAGRSVEHTDGAGFEGLSRAEAIKRVVKAGSKALAKSVAVSAAVLGPGFVLLATGAVVAGMVWLFLGSFGLMAWTYRKPWQLGPISCLIPPLAAAACYAVQLWLFGQAMPPFVAILVAVAAGGFLGFLRGGAHTIYEENGAIFAQRTLAYLGIWVVCYGATQLLGLITRETFLVQGGLVTGAFSTAMLAVVSIMLLQRRKALVAAVSVIALSLAWLPHDAQAEEGAFFEKTEELAQQANKAVNIAVRAFLPTDLGCELQRTDNTAHPGQGHGNFYGSVQYRCEVSPHHKYLVSALARGYLNKSPQEHRDWVDKTRQQFASRVANPGVRWRGFSYANASIGDAGVSSSQHSSGDTTTVYTYEADGTTGGWRIHVTAKAVLPVGSARPRDIGQLTATGIAADIARRVPNLYEGDSEPEEETSTAPGGQQGSSGASPERPSGLSADDLYEVPDVKCGVPGQTAPCVEDGPDTGTGVSRPPGGGPVIVVPPNEDHWHTPPEGAVAAAAAAIAAILLAAGIAANVAQAMAVSMAQAMQAGVELTAEDVRKAALGEAPSPPPPIDDPKDGTAFATNDAGQYWAPDADGNWRWLSESDARKAAAALRAEHGGREQDIARHAQQTEDMLARSRHDTQASYAAERAEEEQATANVDADRKRREALFEGIDKTLRSLPEDARYHAAMAELYDAQVRGDTATLDALWREMSGDRLEQVRKSEEASAVYQRQAAGFSVLEAGAAKTRDLSKVVLSKGLAAATGGTATALEAVAMGVTGMAGISAVSAAEHGYQEKDGKVVFDADKAIRGSIRGARSGLNALVGGVPTNGNLVTAIAKSGFSAASDAAQTVADTHQESGDLEGAYAKGLKAFGINFGKNMLGEYWGERDRQADQRASAANLAEGTKSGGLPNWSEAIRDNQNMLNAAGSKATDLVADTASGVLVDGKDAVTAMGDAVTSAIEGEILDRAGGKMVDTVTSAPDIELTDKQQDVVDRLQADRMDAGRSARLGDETEHAGPPPRSGPSDDLQPQHRHAAEPEPVAQTPADREDAANAAHRDSLRKVWEAEQAARAARELADADPEDTWKQIEAADAQGKLGEAKKDLFKSEIEAQEATEAARGVTKPPPSDLQENEATWDDVLGPDSRPLTPAEREAAADATYRDKQRKVWLAEQEAKAAQERLDADPDDTWSQMNVAEAQGKLQGAKNDLFAAEMEAQDASEARRAPSDEDSGPYIGRDILGVPPEDLDSTLRPIQDQLRQHGDFPAAHGEKPPEGEGAQPSGDDPEPQATKKYEELPSSERPDLQPSSPPDEVFRPLEVPSGPDVDFYDSVSRTIGPEGRARDALDALEQDPTNPELRTKARAAVAEVKARHGELKEAAMIADDRARRRMYPEQSGPGPGLPDDEHKKAWERRRVIEGAVSDNERTVQGLNDRLKALESGAPPPSSPPPQQPALSPKGQALSDIEDILQDAKAKGQQDDLTVLDPTVGENIPGGSDGDGIAQQGARGGSMEEANRREIWLDHQGRPILGSDNPEDRIPKGGYRIRIDPDTGEVKCRFGPGVDDQFKKGIEVRALHENREKIEAALQAQREKLARIPKQDKP